MLMVLGTFWALGMDHVPAGKEPTALQSRLPVVQQPTWQYVELPSASPCGAGLSEPALLGFPAWMLVCNDLALTGHSGITC